MSINDDFITSPQQKVEEVKQEPTEKPKLTKKQKIYFVVFGLILAAVVAIGSVMTYQALTYVVGCFTDYSMAPTINKVIRDENGKEYTYDSFRNSYGNIVEYGLIHPVKTKPTFKRFEVVAIQEYKGEYIFDAFRLVGLPGETVKLDYDGNLFINGEEVKQPIDKEFLKLDWSDYGNVDHTKLYFEETLAEGEYYLLKDNRYYYDNDSRHYGPYKYEDIYGTVVAIQGTCTYDGGDFLNCSFPITRYI